jgi:hypothetical protein
MVGGSFRFLQPRTGSPKMQACCADMNSYSQDDKEGEAKAVKPAIPTAHKAPLFDHPFKPHR